MNNFEIRKEVWIWAIMLLPILYLWHVWDTLPQIVPTHFGLDGKPNDWSDKITLVYLVAGLVAGVYLLLTITPVIDPKGRLSTMGNKYFEIKLFLMIFMCALCAVIIRSAITKDIGDGHIVFLLLGGLFAFLGNYLQAVKPNFFIGIRTPWTLTNDLVWLKTHRLGGRLFFVAGLLIMVLPFVLKAHFRPVFLIIVFASAIIPIVYSFIIYKQEERKIM